MQINAQKSKVMAFHETPAKKWKRTEQINVKWQPIGWRAHGRKASRTRARSRGWRAHGRFEEIPRHRRGGGLIKITKPSKIYFRGKYIVPTGVKFLPGGSTSLLINRTRSDSPPTYPPSFLILAAFPSHRQCFHLLEEVQEFDYLGLRLDPKLNMTSALELRKKSTKVTPWYRQYPTPCDSTTDPIVIDPPSMQLLTKH